MQIDFEYGKGMMSAELPNSTDVFIPGETWQDPPAIPEEALVERTRESVRNPIGMPPLSQLAHKGSTVTIVIPDIVKGGLQPTSHRKVSIRVIVDELYAAGVQKKGHPADLLQRPSPAHQPGGDAADFRRTPLR